jgi:hypothetical protein
MAELVVRQDVAAPAQEVWDLLTDWSRHHEWMLLTRAEGGQAAGEELRARTGLGPLGFTDTMTITVWEPPRIAVVRHTGRLVRGAGSFEVSELAPARSRVIWSEWLDLPFGMVGSAGWRLVKPLARAGVQTSLRRLARCAEAEAGARP